MPKLLVVDDDNLILDCFRYAFPPEQLSLETATSVAQAISLFRQHSFDAVVTDIRLPDSSGLQLLQDLRALDGRVPVILMTGHGTANTAIEAMQQGAFEYLLKPLDVDVLQAVIDRALETSRMTRTPARIAADSEFEAGDADLLVGQCAAMQEVYRQIGRVAGQDATVLILGESGTGKEVVARAIYQYSKRAAKPFLAINCAAIPENLLESELFGHEKGSFTGAERKRIGKFEQCDGGTLFLDEIGDMTPLTQTKVLRVLQDQQFERIGDLTLLINHFLIRFSRELDKQVGQISPEVMNLLAAYPWPGNLRELQSVLKHTVIEATGPVILPEFLPETVRRTTTSSVSAVARHSDVQVNEDLITFIQQRIHDGSQSLYEDVIQRVERTLLTEVLQQVEGNISRASAILGISRSTLRIKLTGLGINLDRSVRMTE